MAEEIFQHGGGGGGAAKVSLNGNTSGTLTLISTGTLFLGGGNNITLSQDGNSITISGGVNTGATTFLAGINGGNTSGDTGTVNNQLVLAGGNNITLSGSKNGNSATVTISGRNYSNSFGISNLGNTSGTSGIASGSQVRYLFAGGNNVTLSQSINGASGTVTISAANQTLQTSNLFDLTLSGNTDGALALVSSGTLTLAGGNNITLSQNGNAITISGPNVAGAQTGISGLSASDTVYTSGTVAFTGAGIVTVGSAPGQVISIDATTSQSVQTESRFNLTLAGNTAGALADVSSGVLTLAGGNNITLSQNGNAVTVSGPILREAVSLAGNSTSAGAGYTLISTGTFILAGGNNITLSQDGHSVTISGANIGGAQTGISSVSVSDTVYTSGGISLVGSGIVTVKSGTGQQVIIDASGGGTGGVAISASDTLYTSGTVVFTGSNNITVYSGTGQQVIISGPTGGGAGISTFGNTAGTTGVADNELILVGGSNITLSQSLNGGSATLTIIGASGGGTGGVAISASDTVYTSGTVKFTGSNNITILSGTGQQVIVSGPTGGGAGMGTGANTSGTSGTVGRELYFYGGANISLSQSVNGSSASLSIIGASGGTGGGVAIADTAASVVSDGTLVFSNSNGISFGLNGSTMTASHDGITSQSVQSYNIVSASGNTDGTLGTQSSGTVVFAGGNNITLSQSSNTISIVGAAAGTGGGISGISASDALYTSGTVRFSGSNNITVVSGTGQAVYISGPTGGGAGMGSAGNSAGTSGTVGRELYFVGGSNITLSQSVNGSSATLTINGASGGTGGGFTAGISTDGNTAGTTGLVPAQIVFVGGTNITLSQSIDASSATLTIDGPIIPDPPAPGYFGVSSLGNTSGDTGVVSDQMVLVGGNNVTLSQATGPTGISVTISGADTAAGGVALADAGASVTSGTVVFSNSNGISFGLNGSTMTAAHNAITSQSVQTYNVVSASGNTSGTLATFSTGTVVFAGGNNITLSQSSNSITISGANAGGAQTGISSISASDTVYTSGQVKFIGTNNITVGSGTGQAVVISGPTGGGAGMGSQGNTAGTSGTVGRELYIVGSNNITLSQSVNGSSATLSIIGGAGGGGVAIADSAATVTSGTVQFANSNGISFGLNGSTMTASHNGITSQSNQILTVYATSNTLSSSSGTVNASSIVLRGIDQLSVGFSNGSLLFEAGGGDAGIDSIGMSNVGNTAGTTGMVSSSPFQMVFAGGDNVTLSQSLNGGSGTITISASFSQSVQPEGAATIGMSNLGNTAGTTGVVNGSNLQYYFAGGNNVTLSQSINGSSATLTISGGAGGGGAALGVTNTGNTSGTNFTVSSGTVYFQGTNNITVSNSSAAGVQTLWLSGPSGGGAGMGTGTNTSGTSGTVGKELFFYGNSAIGLSQSVNGSSASLTFVGQAGGGGATVSEWMPAGVGYSSFTQQGQSSLVLFPALPPFYVTATMAQLWASIALSTSSNSSHNGAISLDVGIYTRNASTLSLASSGSTVHTWNVTGSTSSGSIAGWRALSVPIDVNMSPGRYWIGVISKTATTNANWFTASNMGLIAAPTAYSGALGATNASNQFQLGMGVYSAQTANLPSAVAFSDIRGSSASTARAIVDFVGVTA